MRGPFPLRGVAQRPPLAPALHKIHDRRAAADVAAGIELHTRKEILTVDRDELHSSAGRYTKAIEDIPPTGAPEDARRQTVARQRAMTADP